MYLTVDLIEKLAYSIEMSFDVTEAEKKIAAQAGQLLDQVINLLDLAQDHLDLMYNPFKKYEYISPESLHENRGKLYLFKKQVKKNFDEITYVVFQVVQKLNNFNSDYHVKELINSIEKSMENLKNEIETYLDTLDNFEAADFRDKVLTSLDNSKKEMQELEKLIKERIIEFIDTNILAKNWTSKTTDQFKAKIEDKVPLITELFHERQKALEELSGNVFPDITTRPQTLNPGNVARIELPKDTHPPGPEAGVY